MANARLNFSSRPQRQAPPPWPRLLTYVTLAEVRQYGFELRRLLAAGGDPLEAKRAAKREQLLATTRGRTFKDVALEYIAAHNPVGVAITAASSRRRRYGAMPFPKSVIWRLPTLTWPLCWPS